MPSPRKIEFNLPPPRNPWGGAKIFLGGYLPPPRHPNDVPAHIPYQSSIIKEIALFNNNIVYADGYIITSKVINVHQSLRTDNWSKVVVGVVQGVLVPHIVHNILLRVLDGDVFSLLRHVHLLFVRALYVYEHVSTWKSRDYGVRDWGPFLYACSLYSWTCKRLQVWELPNSHITNHYNKTNHMGTAGCEWKFSSMYLGLWMINIFVTNIIRWI